MSENDLIPALETDFNIAIEQLVDIELCAGKPKRWEELTGLLKRIQTLQRENQSDSHPTEGHLEEESRVGLLDILGTYSFQECAIRLYPEAIRKTSDALGFEHQSLTTEVMIHEIGHAMSHLAIENGSKDAFSAVWLKKCNSSFLKVSDRMHEFLAQAFTWIAIEEAASTQRNRQELKRIFARLADLQPMQYRLWGTPYFPKDESDWEEKLKRMTTHNNHPHSRSHWKSFSEKLTENPNADPKSFWTIPETIDPRKKAFTVFHNVFKKI